MKRLLLTLVFALLLAACAPAATSEPTPTMTPQPAVPIAPATPTPLTLTVWLPDWMALPDAPGYDALMATIDAFEQKNDVDVIVIPKLPRGDGGLLDALDKTKPVAPSVLPDLVALPFQDIPTATQKDLLQPLEGLFSTEIQNDLYTFAQQASMVENAWMAVPFAASFEHISFQPAALSEPPVSWDIILTSESKYAFPAGGAEGAWTDALLLHYLSAVPAGDSPERNKQALRKQLDFYETLYQRGLVDDAMLQINQPEGSWERALKGVVPLAETTSDLWLAQRDEATFLRFGPTPSDDSQARYLIHGWAYAIITADETHQKLAADFINSLMTTETLADWSSQAHVLPARRTSLMQWPQDDYRDFVTEALAQGFLMPGFTQDSLMARTVHQAALTVLSGEMTAEKAWTQAVANW